MKKKTFKIFVILFLGLFFAHGKSQAEVTVAEDGQVTINFQDVEIGSVVKSMSKITGHNFVIDPQVKGKVTVIATHPVPENEVYAIFLSVLEVHDFAAVEMGEITKIVPLTSAKHGAEPQTGERSTKRPQDSVVTRLYKLKHIQAEKLVPVLRPLVPAKSYLAAQVESNMLIISDRAGNIERLIKIVEKIDQVKPGEIEIAKLEHADALDVVKVIEGLEDGVNKGAARQNLQLVADARTNSILISGNEYNLLRVKTLIAHLDTPIESDGATQVIFLRFAKAKDLLPILKGVEAGTNDGKGRPRPPQAARQTDFDVQADEATNALIITAPPAVMRSMLNVIRKLDIRRTQVLIEAIIADINTGKGAELGVQWQATDVTSASDKGVIGGSNFGNGDASPGISVLSANPIAAATSLSGLNVGYMRGTTNILGTEVLNLGVLASALASDTDNNILSTPSVVTLDNEEAEIVVGETVPFATGSYTSASGSSTPDTPFTTYTREDVGLKLKVTPQINEGDTIRLDIMHEVSSVKSSTTAVNIGLQTTDTRTIKTSVMVDDGKILVLGGLISDEVGESEQRVPILGSIPLLGWLFRYTKTNHSKRNLMVFLRPTIMRDEAKSTNITFDKYDYMRRLQGEKLEQGIKLLPTEKPPVLDELK